MGQWDYKNYNVAVWSTVDMTDPKVKDFVKDWNITYEQDVDFFMNTVRYHPYAEKIIRFLLSTRMVHCYRTNGMERNQSEKSLTKTTILGLSVYLPTRECVFSLRKRESMI